MDMPNAYDALLAQYYTPADRRQSFFDSLGPLGAGLIAAGAPSTDPGAFGRGISGGLLGMQQTMRQGQQDAFQNALLGSKLEKAQREANADQRWTQMFLPSTPSATTPAASGSPGAPRQANGPAAPGGPFADLGLTPQELATLSMLSREDGMKFLASRQAKLTETGAWEPHVDQQTGVRGQRNKLTGKFEPDPIAVAQASRPSLSVKVENATGEALAKAGVESFVDGAKRLPIIQANLGNLQLMEDALAAASTGWQGERALGIKQAVERLGVRTDAPASELFRSLATKMRLNDIPKGLGSVSNFEQQMYAEASPNLNLTEQGNRMLIRAQRELLSRELQAQQIFAEEMAATPRDAGAAMVRATQKVMQLGPALSPEVQQVLRAAAEAKAPSMSTTPPPPAQPGGPPVQKWGKDPKTGRLKPIEEAP